MTTQFAEASYQEIIDLHTESDTVSVIGLHTPTGTTPQRMLRGFWYQFKKFRYDGCSVSLVPAARLPADPSQVSYGAGEPPIDPRDLLNPIMFHGCHGNDMGNILNELYSGYGVTGDIDRIFTDGADFNVMKEGLVGNDYVDALYYKALTDNTWQKAHPQRGFRKSGLRPMVYSLATNFQIGNIPYGSTLPGGGPNSSINYETGESTGNRNTGVMGASTSSESAIRIGVEPSIGNTVEVDGSITYNRLNNRSSIQFMTPRLQRLSWMDTRQVLQSSNIGITVPDLDGSASDALKIGAGYAERHKYFYEDVQVPKIFMGMIMLPPAYKTEQYFRMIIQHHFSFKNFRGASFQNDNAAEVNNAYAYNNWNTVNVKGDTKNGDYIRDDIESE